MSDKSHDGSSRGDRMHLGLNMVYGGTHPAAWRATYADPFGAYDVEQWVKVARLAEEASFDLLFVGDLLGLLGPVEAGPPMGFDPTILLATLARETARIGLVGTASTSFEEPFGLARRFASLDHLSGGRAGWNIVTTFDPGSARNFSVAPLDREERYARAEEFVEVARALWDSWSDDAAVGDQVEGVFADSARVRPIDHQGEYFQVAGPLTIPRSPQGRPVLVQAGGSPQGLDLAARHAEVVFCAAASLDYVRSFSGDLRRRLVARGRREDAIRLLPGLGFTLGSTEAEALERREYLDGFLGDQLPWLAFQLGVDPDDLDLDRPLPDSLLNGGDAGPVLVNGVRGMIIGLARTEALTAREILRRTSSFHRQVTGTPEQLADTMEEWFRSNAVDGFNLMPDEIVTGTVAFVDQVVPILRRRGLFREAYEGATLREHLGVPRPDLPGVADLAAAGPASVAG